MVAVLLLYIFAVRTSAQTPCFGEAVIADLGFYINKTGSSLYECYKDIPDYKNELWGYYMDSMCYVDTRIFNIHWNNQNVSMCGMCLEIVGPSTKPFHCQVGGYFVINDGRDNSDVVAVPSSLMKIATTSSKGTEKVFNAATYRQTDCGFQTPPKLVVLSKENKTELFIINSNKLVTEFRVNSKKYYINNASIVLTAPFNPRNNISFVTLDRNISSFYNIKLDSTGLYTASSLFPIDVYPTCRFYSSPQIFSVTDKHSKNEFDWKIHDVNDGVLVPHLTEIGKNISIPSINGYAEFFLVSPTVLQLSQQFEYILFNFYAPYGTAWLDNYMGLMEYGNTNASKVEKVCQTMQNKYVFHSVTDGLFNVSVKIYFSDKTCQGFANVINFKAKLAVGKSAFISDIKFKTRDTNTTYCDKKVTSCYDTECTIDKNVYDLGDGFVLPFEDGCYPKCGSCDLGMVCNNHGKCMYPQTKNSRNKAQQMWVLVVCILLCLI
ncbi:hypothetical protein EIN_281330 [Entamoeba invadens IP1]|uniref:Uncharacterized protein n=1 Tax=Entamoeba invadens IP1 TaxID=370355 RepID=A0A0A1TX05_ENTIV|nr:hypothetical protein EIN_281330 [Entamoeba invadens IP1]ELP85772.1 hypothetical protein EIN_281330 [Entamoeba invadens IP1]|eukprot:XP_004185118.1 hypothetical protein EIN_281330 [Entamoeba invadens IP1]